MAWWEVLRGSAAGKELAQRYLEVSGIRILTVDYALAEIAGKLARLGQELQIPVVLQKVDVRSEIVPVSVQAATTAGTLLLALRHVDRQASLADAVMLATAREHGADLVSSDPCFAGQSDVVWLAQSEAAAE